MNNNNIPTVEEALFTDALYPPEVFGILLGQLEDNGQSDTAARLIRRQIENSEKARSSAQSRINHLYGELNAGRRAIIDAELALKSANDKQSQREKENQELGHQVSYQTRLQTQLIARLKTFEES